MVPSQPVKANDDAVDALRYLVLGESTTTTGPLLVRAAPGQGSIFSGIMTERW